MNRIYIFTIAFATMTALARDPVESAPPDPMGGEIPAATNAPTSAPKAEPTADPMGGATAPASDATTNQAVEAVAEPSIPSDPIGITGEKPKSTPSAEKNSTYPTQTSAHSGNCQSKFTL